MNAEQIIQNSQLSQMNIEDTDKSLDGSKTYADILNTVAKAINVVNDALPKMKAAGVDMKKAAYDVDGLMRNIIRKSWGGNEVEFQTTRNNMPAIVAVTQRNIDDIIDQIKQYTANY